MNHFYIYKFDYKESREIISATVIFCNRDEINQDILQAEIKRFYELNYQTDKIYVLGQKYLLETLNKVFIEDFEVTFKGIPKRQETSLKNGIHIIPYKIDGTIEVIDSLAKGFLENFLNEGLQQIFINRGGLVSAEGAHHFVFPSGKHCDKFLRTGNILLFSSEIFFIAFALLKHFDEKKQSQIYCDTSSINSLAFALVELKNRFLGQADRIQIPIESFSSYEGLYKNPVPYRSDSLLIISASTSANIIKYILDKHGLIERDNILILFFLGDEHKFSNIKDQVICNLSQSSSNINGVPNYQTFVEGDCQLCKKGSYPVEVSGDVFLLEKPHVNKILIARKDAESYLSSFVKKFMSQSGSENVFKVNYKESADSKYEIYIDYYQILSGLNSGKYEKYGSKLDDFVNQYIPSNTRKIIALNDEASYKLGHLILEKISSNYSEKSLPELLYQDQIKDIEDNLVGSVVVVGSCISNGKNLLYISRALRKHDKLKIVYFIGISRTKNAKYLQQLKSNLKQGCYGPDTNSFHEIDTIYCENKSIATSWLNEINFLSMFIDFLKDKEAPPEKTISFFEQRKVLLQKSMGDDMRGLSENLFYPSVVDIDIKELKIRKNFAFFDFDDYAGHVSQADIYFTISNILNTLRNNEITNPKSSSLTRSLNQSPFVRNLLDPSNFDRFNDGIIQASILRAARPEELAYNIDSELSSEMYGTFQTLIKYHGQEQGEGLVEFLYALATSKLSLSKLHLLNVIQLIRDNCKEDILLNFADFIEYKLIIEPKENMKEWEKKLKNTTK